MRGGLIGQCHGLQSQGSVVLMTDMNRVLEVACFRDRAPD